MKRFFIPLALLTIITLTTIIYSNSLNSPFQFDDVRRIVDIKVIQSLGLAELFQWSKSRFLTYLTFALNYYFGKYNVFGYHALNTAIHIINSLLIFFLCLLIFKSPKLNKSEFKKYSHLLSFFVSLIFAAHPLQTESVTYIWQRAESIVGVFYFLSLILYAKFRLNQIYKPDKKGNLFLYIASLISIIFCSFVKPTSVTLGIAIFIYEACLASRSIKEFKASLKYLIPVLACILLPILLAKYDILESKNVSIGLNNHYLPYYYTKLRVLAHSLGILIAPVNQRLEYDFIWSISLIKPISTLFSLVLLLSLAIVALSSFRRHPLITFVISWFFLTLSITTILVLDDIFFEHYLYLPLFGYALILPVLSLDFVNRAKIDKKWWVLAFIILIAIYSAAAYNRNKIWRSEISLWEDAVKKSPYKARAHYTLGVYYFRVNRFKEAFNEYELSLRYKPQYPEAYYRLGEYYFKLGDIEKSILNYRIAIELNPEFFEAYLNLGSVYLNIRRYMDSKECFEKALRFTNDPEYIKNINSLISQISRYE